MLAYRQGLQLDFMDNWGWLPIPFLAFTGLEQIGELFDRENPLCLILAHHPRCHAIEQTEIILLFSLGVTQTLKGAERTMFIQDNGRWFGRVSRGPFLEGFKKHGDFAATPGFEEGGSEYYSVAGAERMRDLLPDFDSGTILIGILGQPFKCPPAPFEGALLLHDHLVERGIRADAEIRVIGPMAAPVPITKEVSQSILDALHERGIEYVPKQRVVELDTHSKEARLESGGTVSYDLFVGIPVHRVPAVVESSGLAVDGWVPVDHTNLTTRFPDVYALGDVAGVPIAKAGVFAEAAAAVVADDIGARLRGGVLERPYEGAGSCYIEFGRGMVGKVEANFLGGPAPTARLVGPSRELAAEKEAFASTRRSRWFGS